jgi:hypothetical protein
MQNLDPLACVTHSLVDYAMQNLDRLACLTGSLAKYVRFTSFSYLMGAALTISPGHMVRAVDLNLGPLYRYR